MRIDWQKTASVLFCALVAAGAIFWIGKYVVTIALPFLIAWGLAFSLQPAAKKISTRTGLPLRFSSSVLLTLILLGVGLLLFFGLNRLAEELGRLAEGFAAENSPLWQQLSSLFEKLSALGDRLPFLSDENSFIQGNFDQMISSVIKEAAGRLVAGATALATALIRAVPSIFLFVVVTVIASFYFVLDLETINRRLSAFLPNGIVRRLPLYGQRTRRFVGKYIRAYLLLMFLTFCELFVGFTVLSTEYSLIMALIISAVDILPVLGVGTILVPWSVAELLSRDFKTGFGLLILWGIITVVRQIIEPRIIGGSLGLHPLVTLIGMYVGFRLFGVFGLLAAPAVSVAVKVVIKEWRPQIEQT